MLIIFCLDKLVYLLVKLREWLNLDLRVSPYGKQSAENETGYLRYISTVKILKFGTPQTNPIIVLKIEKFDVSLH